MDLSFLQTLTNASKWIIDLKNREDELEDKINFLAQFTAAFRHQIHTDIQLNPGSPASPSISAHRALLVIKKTNSSISSPSFSNLNLHTAI